MKLHQLSNSTVKSLSERLKDEYTANRLYRYASNCLKNKGFEMAAAYYANEAEDEMKHANGLQEFATDWNVELALLPLGGADIEGENIPSFIEFFYKLEYDLLVKYKKDFASAFEDQEYEVSSFLQKYIDIQTASVVEIADQLNMLEQFDKSDKNWMFNFEEKLFKK